MIAGNNKKVKRVLSWLMSGIVLFYAVGVPWVLASEEVLAPPTHLTSPTPTAESSPTASPSHSESDGQSPAIDGSIEDLLLTETGSAVSESVAVTEVNTSILGDGQITVAIGSPDVSESTLDLGVYPQESGLEATISAREEELSDMTSVDINNSASVSAVVTAEARSGEITQQDNDNGEVSSKTGDATAVAFNIALVNTTLINSELWLGVVGIEQEWEGDIYIPISDPKITGLNSAIKLYIDNNGDVSTTTSAEAKTGEITQTGGGAVETGDATSAASSVVLADTTVIDAEVTAIFVDNLWMWSGEIYNLRGRGSVDSPQQIWQSVNHEPSPGCNQTMSCASEIAIKNEATITLDTRAQAETGVITQSGGQRAETQTGDAVAIANSTALVNTTLLNAKFRLLNLLLAAPWRGNLVFVYPEEEVDPKPQPDPTPNPDTQENETTASTKSEGEQETPRLILSAGHNAEHGIYAGDGVTYDVVIYNDGPITAHNVTLSQNFLTEEGMVISTMQAKVGEIGVNKKRVVHFVLKTGPGAVAGVYITNTVASGESDQGAKTDSNVVVQAFRVLVKNRVMAASELTTVSPTEIVNIEDNVLGVTTNKGCSQCLALPWYIAIWLGSLLYYGVCLKRKDWGSVVRWGLALPLAAYAGLWYSNPDCRSGAAMTLGSYFWCEWFLVVVLGIYLINGMIVKMIKNISKTNVPAMIYFRS